jgi:hypothetical protein
MKEKTSTHLQRYKRNGSKKYITWDSLSSWSLFNLTELYYFYVFVLMSQTSSLLRWSWLPHGCSTFPSGWSVSTCPSVTNCSKLYYRLLLIMKWIEPSCPDLLSSKLKYPAEQIINKVYQLIQIRVTKWNKKTTYFHETRKVQVHSDLIPSSARFVDISKCLIWLEMAALKFALMWVYAKYASQSSFMTV